MASVACLEASVSGSCLSKGALDNTQTFESRQCSAICSLRSSHRASRQQTALPVFSGLGQSLRLGVNSRKTWARKGRAAAPMRATRMALGEDPEFFDNDYVAVGLAHCFVKDDNSKLQVSQVVD